MTDYCRSISTGSQLHRRCHYPDDVQSKIEEVNPAELQGRLKQSDEGLQKTDSLREKVEEMITKVSNLEGSSAELKKTVSQIKIDSNVENLLADVRLLLKKFPLSNVKNFQYLHAVQLTVADMQKQLKSDIQKRVEQNEAIKELRMEVESLKKNRSVNVEENHSMSCETMKSIMDEKMDYDYTDSSHKISMESLSTDSGVYSNKTEHGNAFSQRDSNHDNADKFQNLSDRMSAVEKKVENVRKEQERAKQLERFVMHLHERIKSLDCGRDGKLLWKISGFSTIFDNAKVQENRKQKGHKIDSNSPCDFCSPLFYTAPQGYLMYMRLYPYGCDSAVGKYVSLFVALSPGEFDGVLPWPFSSTIEISILNQEDLSDKWSQIIIPGGNNLQCFQRPSSKSGNMSVGILHFIQHSKLFGNAGSSPYVKNDTVYVEVSIKEVETSHSGPSKPKAARSTAPTANTALRGSPNHRPNSNSGGISLM